MKLTTHPTTTVQSNPMDRTLTTRNPRIRVIIYTLAGLLLASCISILGFYAYIAWTLARPQIEPLVSNPMQAIGAYYENVQFSSRNEKTTLYGWYLPSNHSNHSTHTVIFSHGYGGNREEIWVPVYDLAKSLLEINYNVLMFDYSYVQPYRQLIVSGGVQESDELLGAIDYIKKTGSEQVFVWGFSMGAGTALQAALENHRIDGMILDSTFLLDPDTLYYNVKQQINLPRYPTLALFRLLFPIINGTRFEDIPYNQVKNNSYSMPVFFIHGDQDEKAPHQMIEAIFENQQHPDSTMWLFEGGTHELIYRAAPELYLQKTTHSLQNITLP